MHSKLDQNLKEFIRCTTTDNIQKYTITIKMELDYKTFSVLPMNV